MKYLILLALFSISASAQTIIQTYDTARDKYFWPKLYKDGGRTFYCEQNFSNRKGLNVEHVYPASWIAEHNGCKNRSSCPVDSYHFAAADLHNLWPSRADINQRRSNLVFAEIKGEKHRIKTDVCSDFELIGDQVEPKDDIKGDIARVIFYMNLAYGLPLKMERRMLIKWHERDPVDKHEIKRNNEIFKIQRRRNPFICYDECGTDKRKALSPNEY